MPYTISYACFSHIGNVRDTNQDNFICDGRFLNMTDPRMEAPLLGCKSSKEGALFGVFDGMGGEARGEVASHIAARNAADVRLGSDAVGALSRFCQSVNGDICDYAAQKGLWAMGTTAAMLAFTEREICLCNIGDSKIFRLCDGVLQQISEDHLAAAPFGVKPPLSQNLGIPPDELVIAPYFARGAYQDGDVYLICSDGLTDMLSVPELTEVLVSHPVQEAMEILFARALAQGGKDNITAILCKVERRPFVRFFQRKAM